MPSNAVPPDIGSSAAAILAQDREGGVIAVFARAIYLELGGEVIALVPSEVPSGPLHVRVATMPSVVLGVPARTRSGSLQLDGKTVATPTAVWEPRALADVMNAQPLLSRVVEHRPVLDISSGRSVDIGAWLAPVLAHGEISRACHLLFGRGAGLTPAGDDVAAGILLVTALAGTSDPGHLAAIAAEAPTNAISRAFLSAAASGRGIEPIHTLLSACSLGDLAGARESAERLRVVGHTSGLDLMAGTLAALTAMTARSAQGMSVSRGIPSIHVHG